MVVVCVFGFFFLFLSAHRRLFFIFFYFVELCFPFSTVRRLKNTKDTLTHSLGFYWSRQNTESTSWRPTATLTLIKPRSKRIRRHLEKLLLIVCVSVVMV